MPTVEELQEQNLQLTEQINELNERINTLSQDNENRQNEIENLRAINQRYYNRLIAQEDTTDTDPEEETTLTCEEFAGTINI